MPSSKKASKPGRVYGGIDRETRVAERRERFIDAGCEVFGTVGYRAGTVRVLCKAAGLTDRYFYESFANTEELLCAVYQRVSSETGAEVHRAISKAPREIEAVTRAGLKAFFGCMRDPRVGRILQFEVLGVSSRVDALYQGNNREFADLIAHSISALTGNPMPKSEAFRGFSLALTGASAMVATHWMLNQYKPSQKAVVEACVNVYLGAFGQIRKE